MTWHIRCSRASTNQILQSNHPTSPAQEFSISFANNNLNGNTHFLEGYKSSKTRVCVTVGMMTTGYDCQDILNLAMMRPIFSPTDFIQIKGRGTRRWRFTYTRKQGGKSEEFQVEKDRFKLFDFFANCEYFEEKFDYDEVLKLPQKSAQGTALPGPIVEIDGYESAIPDLCAHFGKLVWSGWHNDRKLFERFSKPILEDRTWQMLLRSPVGSRHRAPARSLCQQTGRLCNHREADEIGRARQTSELEKCSCASSVRLITSNP